MKVWQYLACVSGSIVAVVMALASISYNATLATPEPAFYWLPISNTLVFSVLALAFDLGMIASVFGFLHWYRDNRIRAGICAALFVIASLFSIHSVRGYIAINVTQSLAPQTRLADVYSSLQLQLRQDQDYLAQLRAAIVNAGRRERRDLEERADQLSNSIQETRGRLEKTDRAGKVAPIRGLEWFLAITLWFFNASCWSAWFGTKTGTPVDLNSSRDSVTDWVSVTNLTMPRHCVALFQSYQDWCSQNRRESLAQYSFYARLIELGANKFRDGRNGPTMYVMPAAQPRLVSTGKHNAV